MKKVIKEEKANYNIFDLKRMILKGLPVLVATSMVLSMSGCSYQDKVVDSNSEVSVITTIPNVATNYDIPQERSKSSISRGITLENPFDDLTIESNIESNEVTDRNHSLDSEFDHYLIHYIADDPDLWPYDAQVRIEVDGMILELAHPIETVVDGKIVYSCPSGFVLKGDICYRLSTEYKEAPEGYVLGTDNQSLYEVDTELQYRLPEEHSDCILVGSKAVEVIHSQKETINGLNYDLLPAGYERVNDFGYIIYDAEPIMQKTK